MLETIPTHPLTDEDIAFLDETLLHYGNDDSILCVSELDGFLTAIVSGPRMPPPSVWFPALWGDGEAQPEWPSEDGAHRFLGLVMQHLNRVSSGLRGESGNFEPLFLAHRDADSDTFIVDEWCHGYMRGVAVSHWPELPEDMQTWLDAIAFHSSEETFPVVQQLSDEEYASACDEVPHAALRLYDYWLMHRDPYATASTSQRTSPKIGRNAPCPCGSGKKYKVCCLH